jgi:hypothetical protein
MGSTFVTVDEAAARLDRTRKTIFEYLKKGFLHRHLRNNKVMIDRDEVEQLAVELGTDFPAITRHTMFGVLSRLKKLEEQMHVVEATWGLQERPLRPNPNEASGLFRAATDFLCATEWDVQQLETWAGLFNQVDEETLTRVAAAVNETKPWEVFYRLAGRMVEFVDAVPAAKEVLALKALRAKMEMGRKKVREAALLWIEAGRGGVPDHVFKALDTPQEDLLRRLSRPSGKSS